MGLGRFFTRRYSKSLPNSITKRPLSLETLEDRLALTVTLGTITAPPVLVGKHTYLPLEAIDSNGLPLTYSVTSANNSINANIISTGRLIVMNVSGKDSTGANFSGNLVLKLFEDKAPITTARIIELVNSGFYNGLIFHRVISGFMAQGGDPLGNGTGGSGTEFVDEFNSSLTFNSFGLFAMANAGDDDNDSQFFITDTSSTASFPQHLNFNHTIFGQIVDGLDIFQKVITTPVTNSKPNTDVVINHASVINSSKYAILDLSSLGSFTGTGSITVTAKNSRNETATRNVNVTVQADSVNGVITNDRPFLNATPDRQTNTNTPITFDISAVDLENDDLTFVVRNANFSVIGNNADVSVSIVKLTNTTARVTLTPAQDFTGLLNLKIGVTSNSNNPVQDDFDTQNFNLLVTDNPISPVDLSLIAGSQVNPGNTVTNDTPTIQLTAPAGQTVKIYRNGTQIGTATQTSVNGDSAIYRYTFTSNTLMVGENVITAVVSSNGFDSLPSAALKINFAPLMQQIYVVPGNAGEMVELRFDFIISTAGYKNELGLYVVDDLSGSVDGVAPTASNYWSKVSASSDRQVLFSFQPGGTRVSKTLTFPAGTKLAFYLSANSTITKAVANSSSQIYSSIRAANKDGIYHAEHFTQRTGNRAIYGFEDTWKGGDRDYNDLVFSIRKNPAIKPVGALAVDLAGNGLPVTTKFAMLPTLNSRYRPMGGEIGIFQVLDAEGTIPAPIAGNPDRTLKPGDVGYAQAALSLLSRQALFTKGDKPGEKTRSLTMASGSFFGVYYIPRGTADSFLTNNPSNVIASNKPIAYFSFAAANPDGGKEHMRTYGRNAVSRTHTGFVPGDNDPQRIHMMGVANGSHMNYSDFILTYSQSV